MTIAAVVRLHRTIPAPPEREYRAWLEPELLRRWLAPGSLEVTRVEVDEQVGGHYRIWHGNADSEVGGFECELLELVPAQRIVFRWGFVGPERLAGPAYDSLRQRGVGAGTDRAQSGRRVPVDPGPSHARTSNSRPSTPVPSLHAAATSPDAQAAAPRLGG